MGEGSGDKGRSRETNQETIAIIQGKDVVNQSGKNHEKQSCTGYTLKVELS